MFVWPHVENSPHRFLRQISSIYPNISYLYFNTKVNTKIYLYLFSLVVRAPITMPAMAAHHHRSINLGSLQCPKDFYIR